MGSSPIDHHGALEDERSLQVFEVLPVFGSFDGSAGKSGAHEGTVDPCGVSPRLVVDILREHNESMRSRERGKVLTAMMNRAGSIRGDSM
jgi:hypothetical protein